MKITDNYIFLLETLKFKREGKEKVCATYHLCPIKTLKPNEKATFDPGFYGEEVICKEVTETEVVLNYRNTAFSYRFGQRNEHHEIVLQQGNFWEHQFPMLDDTKYRKFYIVNHEDCMKKMHEAAETGNDTAAQYFLGYCYYYGSNEMEKNKEESLKWLRKAAERGYTEAQRMLGHILPHNDYEACHWLMECGDTQDADELMRIHQMMQ
jgi:hypothetical protein